jgi:hypothetical protein
MQFILERYLHHCISHGTPSWFPSIFTPGQLRRNNHQGQTTVFTTQATESAPLPRTTYAAIDIICFSSVLGSGLALQHSLCSNRIRYVMQYHQAAFRYRAHCVGNPLQIREFNFYHTGSEYLYNRTYLTTAKMLFWNIVGQRDQLFYVND